MKDGALGRFVHGRKLVPIDEQTIIRTNRDTLYSTAVFDLDAGTATITSTRDTIGTRYAATLVRTSANANDSADVKAVGGLQNAVVIARKGAGQ